MLQPALYGGLFIGVLSALPVVNIGNCCCLWFAGGGVRGGKHYGETDELGYKAVKDRVSINDLHATILHLIGVDHEKLTYRFNGRDFRLTDVAGEVVEKIIT